MNSADDSFQRTIADLVIEYLEIIGVEFVFGVPGGAIEPLYNAMARSERAGGLKTIVARHEAGAAFMADGYSRETGQLGVCCSTTGPGATNLLTGVASAYADNVPMLVITAQTALPNFGKRALQESSCTSVNTVNIFENCTYYNTLVSHPEQIEIKLITAIMATHGMHKGPAHISIPRDILEMPAPQRAATRPETLLRHFPMVDTYALDRLCNLVDEAHNVVIFIGEDSGEAINNILTLSERMRVPIVCSPTGKIWMNSYHPYYRGVFGFAGHQSARDTLANKSVDLILAIGSNLGEMATSGWDQECLLNHKLVHIDKSAEHFTRSSMAKLHVCGDINIITDTLIKHIDESCRWGRRWSTARPQYTDSVAENGTLSPSGLVLDNFSKCCSDDTPIKPQRLMLEMSNRLPSNTRVYADAGNCWAWMTHYLNLSSHGCYQISMGYGAMGWAIGAAVGNALANRDDPVFCFTGDGSFLMSAQELTVAVQHQLPVVFVVLNDACLGMVKHGQRLAGAEQIAFELPKVDFAGMAKAMGANSYAIRTVDDLLQLDMSELCLRGGPTLLDVYIDGEEVPPMGSRMKTLNSAMSSAAAPVESVASLHTD